VGPNPSLSGNIFYLPNGSDIWIDMAKRMQNAGRNISLFLGDDRLIDPLKMVYPDCNFLSPNSLKNGRFTRFACSPMPSSLRSTAEFLEYEKYAMYSLQRNCAAGDVSYLDRQYFVGSLTDFLYKAMSDADLSHIVLGEAPHTASGLLAIGIAASLGLPILHFQQCGIAPMVRPRLGSGFLPWSDAEAGRSSCGLSAVGNRQTLAPDTSSSMQVEPVSSAVRMFFLRLGKHESDKLEVDRIDANRRYRGPIGFGRRVLQSFFDLSRLKNSSGNGSTIRYAPLQPEFSRHFEISNLRSSVRLARRNSAQMRLIEAATRGDRGAAGGNLLTYFLHFEPELTSLPTSGIHFDQTLVIRAIALSLPEGWRLEVREHPAQATFVARGYRGRSRLFYDEIRALPKTTFQSHSDSIYSVIKKSSAVATLGGTVAIEAMALGVPTLCFGRPWYQGLPGCVFVDDLCQVRSHLDQIVGAASGHELNEASLLEFLDERFFPLAPIPSAVAEWRQRGVEPVQDVDALQRCIEDFLNGAPDGPPSAPD
jgi:hypothetical protein